jgi:Protein of unknown function (DUF4242)
MSEAPERRQQSYLVEHYRPGLSAAELEGAAGRVRDAVGELQREGEPVRFLHSTIVAADESFLCVLEAASEQLVRTAFARAGVSCERISAALTEPQ